MRILITADPELPVPPVGYGGIERIVDGLVRAFRTKGHEVGLVANAESKSPADSLIAWTDTRSAAQWATIRNMLQLQAAVDAFRPDVLQSFSRLAYLLPLLGRRLPKVMSYQRHTGGRQISIAARLSGPSLHFTGCSNFISAQGARAGGIWSTVHNFVEIDRISYTHSVPDDAPLLFLSRIESIKGADWAIEIARRSGRRLIIAGNHATSGPELRFWERQIAPQVGRNGVSYVGEVNDHQKSELLRQAAALVVPIQWDEPFGIVFAEALAAGTPVISCPRGALPEIVEHGRHGFLVHSVEEGIAAVHQIRSVSRAACRERVERLFSSRTIADQYLALYAALHRGETLNG